jgi:hypothetical protein
MVMTAMLLTVMKDWDRTHCRALVNAFNLGHMHAATGS